MATDTYYQEGHTMTTKADSPKVARATIDSILEGVGRLRNFSDADLVEYGSTDLGVIDETVWGLIDAIEEGDGIEDPDETTDEPGVLHRHADGRQHRHFSAGFEIGGQVRADDDGTDDHQHFSVSLGSGERSNESGPVVWTADAGELEHDDLEAAKAQAAELARRHVFVAVRETGCVDDGTRRYLVSAYSHHVKPAQYLDLRIVAWNTTAEIDR